MSVILNIAADLLVAVLLVGSIATSVALSRRITRLKADESAMRRTTGELVRATETAERAIAGLRTTLGECDRTLAERLRNAERFAADLAKQVEAGSSVITRVGRIVEAGRKVALVHEGPGREPVDEAPAPERNSTLDAAAAAANALAERAQRRLRSRAA
jgi:hypothetical protein